LIDAARQLVARLPNDIAPPPDVVPSADGTLQLEWNEGRRSLELEIETISTIHYLKWHPEEGIEEEETIDIEHIEDIVRLIRWFAQGVVHVRG
jgi:hypothetical protein